VPGGWRVTYQQYGNEEVVPYEYIRAMSKTTEEGGEDEFVIPEHLKVLDTDTEKERNRKRKAVKAIKNSFRQHQCVLLPVLASRVLMHGPPCVPQPAPAPCGRPTEPIKSTSAPHPPCHHSLLTLGASPGSHTHALTSVTSCPVCAAHACRAQD
jgi:hypothetical protein